MGEWDFLGRGPAFPIGCDPMSGALREAAEEEDIRQAILIIVSTRKGERVMRPDFGCDIYNYAFGTMDYTTLKQMENSVRDALIRWEPRIRDLEVSAEPSKDGEGVVNINIHYLVRSTNNRYNMVYPFYLSEGTGGE